MDLSLTERGKETALLQSALFVFLTVLGDLLLTTLFLLSVVIVLMDLIAFLRKIRLLSRLRIAAKESKVRMIAGTVREIPLKGRIPPYATASLGYPWVRLVRKGSRVLLRLKPEIKGDYSISNLELTLGDKLGLLEAKVPLKLDIRVRVYPRVYPMLLMALRLLSTGRGVYYMGSEAGHVRGKGLEYLFSREYMPDDDPKVIDWKSTARLFRLIAKESSIESLGSYLIVYDIRSHGPRSSDILASLFIASLLSTLREGSPTTLIILEGDRISYFSRKLDPRSALEIGVAKVLEDMKEDILEIFEMTEPSPLRESIELLLGSLIEDRRQLELMGKGPSIVLRESMSPVYKAIYLIHSLIIDATLPLELAESLKGRKDLVILTESKPWLDSTDLEEAYSILISYEKIINALEKYKGVRVYSPLG